jgi:hypothetical protein
MIPDSANVCSVLGAVYTVSYTRRACQRKEQAISGRTHIRHLISFSLAVSIDV